MALRKFKYLIARRVTQIVVMVLFVCGFQLGWTVIKGNLSSAMLFGVVPLSDPYHVLQMFSAMAIPANDALTGAVVVLAFYAAIAGRAFCGWVCPVNLVTDAANWMRKVFGIEASARLSRDVRYWILGLSFVVSLAMGVAAFEWISPISMLHRGIVFGMGFGWLAIISVFMLDLMVVKNGFCGHLCPLGGFYAVTGRYNVIKPKYDDDKCTKCMKCIEICPERQVLDMVGKKSGLVLSGECVNCGRCIEVCDDDAINFSSRFS